jgi:hypothetical protein
VREAKLRRGRGRKWAAAMFHVRRERAATAATEANGATCSLWRRRHANRDQWRIGRIRLDPACDLTLADKLRLISRRPAIGAHQNLVAAARSGAAAGKAVELDHPAGRPDRMDPPHRYRPSGRAVRRAPDRLLGPDHNRQVPPPRARRKTNVQYAFFQSNAWDKRPAAPHQSEKVCSVEYQTLPLVPGRRLAGRHQNAI